MVNIHQRCRLCFSTISYGGIDCLSGNDLRRAIKDLYGLEILATDECSKRVCKSCYTLVGDFWFHSKTVKETQNKIKLYIDEWQKQMRTQTNDVDLKTENISDDDLEVICIDDSDEISRENLPPSSTNVPDNTKATEENAPEKTKNNAKATTKRRLSKANYESRKKCPRNATYTSPADDSFASINKASTSQTELLNNEVPSNQEELPNNEDETSRMQAEPSEPVSITEAEAPSGHDDASMLTSISNDSPTEPVHEETVATLAPTDNSSSVEESNNEIETENNVTIAPSVFEPTTCSTCQSIIYTRAEEKFHEVFHETTRCASCNGIISRRRLIKHFHKCFLQSSNFSTSEVLMYMTPCVVKLSRYHAPDSRGSPNEHQRKQRNSISSKKKKIRLRITLQSRSSDSDEIANVSEVLSPKNTARSSDLQRIDAEKKGQRKKPKTASASKKNDELMPSLQVNNSIKVWLDLETTKEKVFTLQDCPETHNTYIDLEPAQLDKETNKISDICSKIAYLRKQKNVPPAVVIIPSAAQASPVVTEKVPMKKSTALLSGLQNNENSRVPTILRRLSLGSRSAIEKHQSSSTIFNKSYTLPFNDTVYNPSSGLHLNISMPQTCSQNVLGTSSTVSTPRLNQDHSNQNQTPPVTVPPLSSNARASRPLTDGPIMNTSFKILSPNELNLRAERMAVSEQRQNRPQEALNFYGSLPAIESNSTSSNIRVALIRDKNGHLELILRNNEKRFLLADLNLAQQKEVQKSLLQDNVWHTMLGHIKEGEPSRHTLRLFQELLPPQQAKVFFDELQASNPLLHLSYVKFLTNHDN